MDRPGVPILTFSLAVIPKPNKKKMAVATQKTGLRSYSGSRTAHSKQHRRVLRRRGEAGTASRNETFRGRPRPFETVGLSIGQHVNDGVAGKQARGDHLVVALVVLQVVPADDLFPDPAAACCDEVGGLALELELAVRKHRHPRAQVRDVVDDVRGKDDDDVVADFGKQVEEPVAFLRIETAVGSSTMISSGLPISALAIPQPLPHAARKARERLVADRPRFV